MTTTPPDSASSPGAEQGACTCPEWEAWKAVPPPPDRACPHHGDQRAGEAPTGLVTMTFSKAMAPTMVKALRTAATTGEFDAPDASWLLDWADDLADFR